MAKNKRRKDAQDPWGWVRRKVRCFLSRYHAKWSAYSIEMLDSHIRALCGTHCRACDAPIHKANIGLDHVMPLSRGGDTSPDNIMPMHAPCNRAKGVLTGDEWVALVQVLRGWPPAVRLSVIRRLRAGWRVGWLERHSNNATTKET